MIEKIIKQKLEKLDKISRTKWLSKFPEHFPNKVWNGDLQRQESLLIKELDKLNDEHGEEFFKALDKANVSIYYLTQNRHDGKWGLDASATTQGGGVIAQSNNEEESIKIAFEVYGINKYFII